MKEVNFISHLRGVMARVQRDKRLNPSHISLYMALFMIWNENFFRKEFPVSRAEVMELAKLGSTKTYHKCIRDLNEWKYLLYLPSHNPFKGSTIKMFLFKPSEKQAGIHSYGQKETSEEQAVLPLYKTIENIKKHNKQEKVLNVQKEKEETTENFTPVGSFSSNLHTTTDKNYDEPL